MMLKCIDSFSLTDGITYLFTIIPEKYDIIKNIIDKIITGNMNFMSIINIYNMSKKISMTQSDLFVIMILTCIISILVYENNIIVKAMEYFKDLTSLT